LKNINHLICFPNSGQHAFIVIYLQISHRVVWYMYLCKPADRKPVKGTSSLATDANRLDLIEESPANYMGRQLRIEIG
jgi:hypothetical protein